MRTARRLVRDESGMTMALAIIMIVLLGVMGAGLLTFVSRDLNTVIEENRGQRAFEVADAGIAAAKRQLASSVVREHYNDTDVVVGAEDIQWSAAKGGLTLDDLDSDATTPDSVNVKIQYKPKTDTAEEHFLVVSEGTYGDPPLPAKRRIEAIFEGVVPDAGGGGDGLGHPVYYTPSDIKITNNDTINNNAVYLNQISMFTQKNILIQGVTSQAAFAADYANNSGAFKVSGGREELCDWNSEIRYQTPCFRSGTGTWNTISRSIVTPGFGAEHMICGFTSVTTSTCDPTTSRSIADGVRGFDRTTGPNDGLSGLPNANTDDQGPRGQRLTFVNKEALADGTYPRNEDGTISYPFPELVPIAEAFRDNADARFDFDPSTPYPEPDSAWGLNNNDGNRITFIDAGNRTLTFNPGGGLTKGIIAVWCGRVLQSDSLEGIILNLYGDDLAGNTQCGNNTTPKTPNPETVGTYVNQGVKCACWVYAEGGTANIAGIELLPGSEATFRPGARWSFQSSVDFFETPPPTSFALRNWRELYE